MNNPYKLDLKKKFGEIVVYIRQSLARSIVNNMISAGLLQKDQSTKALEIIAEKIDM